MSTIERVHHKWIREAQKAKKSGDKKSWDYYAGLIDQHQDNCPHPDGDRNKAGVCLACQKFVGMHFR